MENSSCIMIFLPNCIEAYAQKAGYHSQDLNVAQPLPRFQDLIRLVAIAHVDFRAALRCEVG